MAAIAIVGKSGTGKSTSYGSIPSLKIKGLNPKETVVINISGKDLPFPGWKKKYTGTLSDGGNYLENGSSDVVTKAINFIDKERSDIKNIVIDDAQYLMSFEFLNRAKESGYQKFADIGVSLSKVVNAARQATRLNVFFIWHPETDGENGFKMKTVGKMVDTYLTLEGLFTVVLYSDVEKTEDNKIQYSFVTNYNGTYPAKSPVGMFESNRIPNDLGYVVEQIEKYNS